MERPVLPPVPAMQPHLRPESGSESAIRKAAQEFEALVLTELLAPVFEPLDTEGVGGGGAGERMFRPMLVQHYAQLVAASGGVGFADAVTQELMALQSAAPSPEAP